MRLKWSELEVPWQVCLEEAWDAFCCGTVPIGAAIFTRDGVLLARARNHIRDDAPPGQIGHHDLAHAEINALLQVTRKIMNPHTSILYTAVEPCPLCMGAIYMAGIRNIHYLARDTFAGATDLLGKTWYLSRKKINVQGPVPQLEDFLVTLQTAQHLEMGYTLDDYADLYARWRSGSPSAVQKGIEFFENGRLKTAVQEGKTISEMIELMA